MGAAPATGSADSVQPSAPSGFPQLQRAGSEAAGTHHRGAEGPATLATTAQSCGIGWLGPLGLHCRLGFSPCLTLLPPAPPMGVGPSKYSAPRAPSQHLCQRTQPVTLGFKLCVFLLQISQLLCLTLAASKQVFIFSKGTEGYGRLRGKCENRRYTHLPSTTSLSFPVHCFPSGHTSLLYPSNSCEFPAVIVPWLYRFF